jgi:putative heme-binding domain-containing protein
MIAPRFASALVTMTLAPMLAAFVPIPQNPDADTGGRLFRERCAECHGADGKGVINHDLTRLSAAGATDERLLQTIRNGVPNTIMPSSTAPDAELRTIVSYLRSLGTTAAVDTARGNAVNGERLFWASCGSCHTVGTRGGAMGPDLSRIGAQPRDALTRSIREPNAAFPAGFQTVTLVTRDGQRIRGTRKSEDAFSIQIMDTREQLKGYLKSTLKEVVNDPASLMPAFGPDKLNDGDLNDVLAYLGTLRPPAGAGRGRGGPGGGGGGGRGRQ